MSPFDPDTTSAGFSAAYNAKNQTTAMAGATFAYADAGQAERTREAANTLFNGVMGISATSNSSAYFTRDPAGNLISMRVGTASYYYTLDALGSVLALTDATGNVDVATYSYDPYGVTTVSNQPLARANPFRYTGGYQDDSTGLYKFGERYYDPSLGRWTQMDPSGQDPNIYSYVGNDPANRVDLTGLASFKCQWWPPSCAVYLDKDETEKAIAQAAVPAIVIGAFPNPVAKAIGANLAVISVIAASAHRKGQCLQVDIRGDPSIYHGGECK